MNIELGSKVIVSDPCYELDTWCQSIVDIKSGNYKINVYYSDLKSWGNRVSCLEIIHEDYNIDEESNWELLSGDIGVDSGQCGFYDYEKYKDLIGTGECDEKDTFYGKACFLTDQDEQYGIFDQGIVSRSGLGDGVYDLFGIKQDDEIVALKVIFLDDNESEEE